MTEKNKGQLVALNHGDREVTPYPGGPVDVEKDTAELEAKLLKAAKGPFTPYSSRK